MTEDDLYTRLAEWLGQVTGLPEVIRDHLGRPRPVGPYAMINLIGAQRLQWPSWLEYAVNPVHVPIPANPATEAAAPFLQVPVTDWEWQFSFNVYASRAMDVMRLVTSTVSVQAGGESLLPLIVHSASAVRRIPERIGTGWEERAQMDLFVRSIERDGIPVDVIEHVTPRYFENEEVAPMQPIITIHKP